MHPTQEPPMSIPTTPEAVNGTPPQKAPTGRPPTCAERRERVHELQYRALRHPDPLLASLEIMSGDLMLFAFRLRELMAENLTTAEVSAERAQHFLRQADTYLKFVRQVDRLAQISRHQRQGPQSGSEPN
jgi:hypothetical protein